MREQGDGNLSLTYGLRVTDVQTELEKRSEIL